MKMYKKLGLFSFVVLALGAGWFYLYGPGAKQGGSNINYRQVLVGREKLEVLILSTGVVQPENRVEIKPPIAGRVERVLVKEGDRVKKGQTLAWMSSTERAALLDAATGRGAEELKEWQDMYRPTPVLAPITGTVIQRNVESGQVFTTADAVLVMSDRLTVKAQVDETDIAQIKLKQSAVIVLDAYPNQSFEAHVDQIAYDAKTVNNVTTYVVDVLPEKTPEFMRSGMTANVSFSIASKPDALVVPADAIKTKDSKIIVLVPGASSREKPVEQVVEVGLSDGKRTEIVSGIQEGATILVPEFRTDKKASSGSSPFSPMQSRPRGR